MVRKYIIFIVFIVQGFYLFATEQESDIIIINGVKYSYIINDPYPMELYFNEFPEKRPPMIWTSLWRGYIATFEIIENELWVIKIEKHNDSHERIDITRESMNGNDKMKIDWFNGILLLPHGNRVERALGFDSIIFEYYKIIEIQNGNLIRELDINNEQFVELRDRQFELYKQTEEYNEMVELLFSTKEEAEIYLKMHTRSYFDYNIIIELLYE